MYRPKLLRIAYMILFGGLGLLTYQPNIQSQDSIELKSRIESLEMSAEKLASSSLQLEQRVNVLEIKLADLENTSTEQAINATVSEGVNITSTSTTTLTIEKSNIVNDIALSATILNSNMVGNVMLILPPINDDSLQVIPLWQERSYIRIFVRNNTDAPIKHIEVKAIAKDENGSLLAVGENTPGGIDPYVINPGEVGYGGVTFGSIDFPANAIIEYSASGDYAEADDVVKVKILEYTIFSDRVVGQITSNDDRIIDFAKVYLLCFDNSEQLVSSRENPIDSFSKGESIPFQIEYNDDCPNFLIFPIGYAKPQPKISQELPPSKNADKALKIGDKVTVKAGYTLTLRSKAGRDAGEVVAYFKEGDIAEIVDGPILRAGDSDTIVWWLVRLEDGDEAWGAANTSLTKLLERIP